MTAATMATKVAAAVKQEVTAILSVEAEEQAASKLWMAAAAEEEEEAR